MTVPWAELVAQAGVAELGFTGPASLAELRPLLQDCDLTRIILGADSVPIEVSKRTRNVPAGLWAALVARDGGCAWPGCDAPPAWCQAAHGNLPYRHDGKLKLSDAALLCLRHHRRFDHDGWELAIDGTTVTFHPTNQKTRTDQTGQPDQPGRPGRPPDDAGGHDLPDGAGGHDPPNDHRRRAGQPDRPPDDAGGHDPPDNGQRTGPPDRPPDDAGGCGRPGDSDRAPP